MRNWILAFLLGGVVGAVVTLLVAIEPEPVRQVAPDDLPAPIYQVAPPTTGRRLFEAFEDRLPADASNARLADTLELAAVDRGWEAVEEVARVLRERASAGAPDDDAAPDEGSIVRLDQEYRSQALLKELRARDNPATRLLAAASEDGRIDPEAEERLIDLFLAPVIAEGDAVVRRDAALVLALAGGEPGRRVLLQALRGADAELADLAAEALARSEEPAAVDALLTVLEEELDAELRARVARALALEGDLLAREGRAAGALARAARGDRDPAVRELAIAALARADLGADPALREALAGIAAGETEPVRVRQAAVAAIRAHHGIALETPPELVGVLERLLESTRPPLRLEVIEALAEVGTADTLPRVEAALLSAATPAEREALARAVESLRQRSVPR